MALPTGTFQKPDAGLLQVTLTADFFSDQATSPGFPNTGTNNVAVRGYFGPSGAPSYTPTIDKYQTSASISIPYPGGNVAWPVGVELVAESRASGAYRFGFTNIKLSFQLIKR